MKHLFFLALMFIFSGFPLAGAAKPGGGKAPSPVIVETVRTETFEDRIEALGTLRANETVTLTATVTEVVTSVNFQDGQRVEKGAALVEMTSAQEKAELGVEKATVGEARRQVERLEPLIRAGAVSKSLLDQRRRELETAKARLEAVQSRIGDRIVVAPFSGVLGFRNISVGAVLQPGMRITTLDDDSVMKLDFSVPSVFLSSLKPGLAVAATSRAFEGRVFTGVVSSIDSQIDPVTRAISVRAILPNDERLLRPGLLMNVDILKNPRQSVVIPEESIVPEGRKNAVFVVEAAVDGSAVARKRAVELGARRPGVVEIVGGLSAGEKVVTHGTMKISDGAAVEVKEPMVPAADPARRGGN